MIVYKVIKEVTVDVGNLSFTLHPGDYFKYNGEHIETIHYHTIYGDGILNIDRNKIRTFSSLRVGNNVSWTPLSRSIGKEIEDITIQYNRDSKLSKLLC